ncbi:conserved protein of unknown function [Tenacibaculum sp. 190524A02b]|uniref:Bacteriocin n=1 Tax=Tenacibaculum vairaonense TaxID=3137860 RepID=A0ABM9PK50_9FLAO
MKKQILNLGKSLTKNELKTVNGSGPIPDGCITICVYPEPQRQDIINDQLRRFGYDYSNCNCN